MDSFIGADGQPDPLIDGADLNVSAQQSKISKEEIEKMVESDEEDAKIVDQIEEAHVTRLNAEKEDNQQLKG